VSGSQPKWLSGVDEHTRQGLASEVNRGITSEDVIDAISELFVIRGVTRHIRSDNGPGIITHALRRWARQGGVDAMFIEPGSPSENGYAERFHGHLRSKSLRSEVFDGVRDTRGIKTSLRDEYNTQRRRSTWGYKTPAWYAAVCMAFASAKASAHAERVGFW